MLLTLYFLINTSPWIKYTHYIGKFTKCNIPLSAHLHLKPCIIKDPTLIDSVLVLLLSLLNVLSWVLLIFFFVVKVVLLFFFFIFFVLGHLVKVLKFDVNVHHVLYRADLDVRFELKCID